MSGQEFFESEADDSDEELLMAQSKANFGSVEAKLELLERVKDTLQLKLTRRSRRMREMGQIMANSAEKMQQKCQIIADQKAKIHNLEKNLIQTSLTFQREFVLPAALLLLLATLQSKAKILSPLYHYRVHRASRQQQPRTRCDPVEPGLRRFVPGLRQRNRPEFRPESALRSRNSARIEVEGLAPVAFGLHEAHL